MTWLDNYVMNVGRGETARKKSLEEANEMQAQAKTPAQREEAEFEVKKAMHLIQWCEAASNIRPQKFKRIDAAARARDSFHPLEKTEEYNAAEKHAEDVMTREIGMPETYRTSKARGIKKSKVAPATKDEVLARLSKVMTNNMDTSVGSLTRLMVKTYNDAKAARGIVTKIEFTDFGDDADNNMMLVHKPLRKSTGGKAPRKQNVVM